MIVNINNICAKKFDAKFNIFFAIKIFKIFKIGKVLENY